MSREPNTWLGWLLATCLWFAALVAAIFVIIFASYGVANYAATHGKINSNKARVKSQNQSYEAFWNLCKKQIRAGVVKPYCVPLEANDSP